MAGNFFLSAMALWYVAVTSLFAAPMLMAQDVPMMSREALKGILGEPDLIILDVRRGRDWRAGEFRIQGAVRADPKEFGTWKNRFPKDKTLVLYCA